MTTAAGNVRILLVEDDHDDFLALQELVADVEGWNPELAWVSTYDEALVAIESGAFDVVVADYEVGVRYGVELLEEQRVRAAGVPVIVMTAQGRQVDLEAAAAGAVDSLRKGEVTALALERAVRYAVESARRSRAERRFRALIERSSDLVTVLDGDGTVLYAGGAVGRMLGVGADDAVGRSLWELVGAAAGEAEVLREALAAAVGEPSGLVEGEMRIRSGATGARHVEYAMRNLLHDPEVHGVVLTAHDCTDRIERERRIRFQAELLDRVGHVVFVVDDENNVTYWNRAAEHTLGWTWDEVRGQPIGPRIVPPQDREQLTAIREIVLREGAWEGEMTLLRRDGQEVVILGSVTLAEEPAGSRIAAGVDVTELRRAEEQHERLLTLLDSTPDFVGIATIDQDVTHINPAGRRMVGLPVEGPLVGVRVADLHPPHAMKRLREEAFPAAAAKGTWSGETALRRRDGTEVPVWQVVVAHRSDTGDMDFLSTIASDLTEWKQAMEQLYFQTRLLDAVGQAVIGTDVDGAVTYWNRAAEDLYGWSAREVMGRPILDLTPSSHSRSRAVEIMAALGRGESWTGDLEVRRKDGAVFPALITNAPIRDESGALVGAVGVSSDLSEQRRLEAELRQAQKMDAVGRLAGGVAHDFNNLLTVMQLHLQLLLEGPDSGAAIVPDLLEIQTASRRAAELTRHLLAFGRKQVFEERVVDLRDEVQGMRSMLRRLVPESIDLDVDISPRPTLVSADPSQVRQVVLNLVVNSVDAMEDRGKIRIRVDRTRLSPKEAADIPWKVEPGEYARLTVHDTGTGMSEEVQARVFEPFFTTKDLGKGTGLGLASVYGIVKQSGGHVFVESAPDAGATFRVLLPAAGSDPSTAEAVSGPTREKVEERDGARTETILVVEDDTAVRNVAVRVLESQGYQVLTATNGQEAVELTGAHPAPIDLVITDIVMPEMGGVDLARRLRLDRPEIPVVFMSGYPREEADVDFAELGVAFLPKPFTVEELLDVVRGAIGR